MQFCIGGYSSIFDLLEHWRSWIIFIFLFLFWYFYFEPLFLFKNTTSTTTTTTSTTKLAVGNVCSLLAPLACMRKDNPYYKPIQGIWVTSASNNCVIIVNFTSWILTRNNCLLAYFGLVWNHSFFGGIINSLFQFFFILCSLFY